MNLLTLLAIFVSYAAVALSCFAWGKIVGAAQERTRQYHLNLAVRQQRKAADDGQWA